jgi:hypothetical protein
LNAAKWRELILGFGFIGGAALPAHFAFSWMGFNPTDDGVFLAAARRILNGQVPHRDFIWPYPALTSIVHAPEVAFGCNHILWLSRLILWIELAALAWCWTLIASSVLQPRPSSSERIAMGLPAFAISIHTFQLITWYTIDALFALSLGIALRLIGPRRMAPAAYFLMGCACLFKQSFLPAAPLLLIMFGDWRKPSRVIAAAAPPVAYGLFLLATGALRDAIVQCSARTNIIRIGLEPYVAHWEVPLGAAFGLFSLYLARRIRPAAFLILAPVAGTALIVAVRNGRSASAFLVIFGIAAGATYGIWRWFPERRPLSFIGALALIAGWFTSLSYGENHPGFAAGALSLFLVACFYAIAPRAKAAAVCALSVFVVACIAYARYDHSDGDRRPAELRYALDGVLPGAAGLRTNVNTFRYLADMAIARKRAGVQCAVLPDNAGIWVASPQPNPLSIDWVQLLIDDERLGTSIAKALDNRGENPLQARIIGDLDRQRGKIAVLIQKVEAGTLYARIEPLHELPEWKPVVDHVRNSMVKVDETEFFDIYR